MGRDELLEEVMQIYYNPETNVFIDEGGYEIPKIYSILSPNVVYLLRHKRDDMFIYGINGEYIELIYEDVFWNYEDVYEDIYGDHDRPIDRLYI